MTSGVSNSLFKVTRHRTPLWITAAGHTNSPARIRKTYRNLPALLFQRPGKSFDSAVGGAYILVKVS